MIESLLDQVNLSLKSVLFRRWSDKYEAAWGGSPPSVSSSPETMIRQRNKKRTINRE